MTADIRAWAERTAPTLTDEDWDIAEHDADPGWGPGGLRANCYKWPPVRAQALLAHVEELARAFYKNHWDGCLSRPSVVMVKLPGAGIRSLPPSLGRAVLRARARLGLG